MRTSLPIAVTVKKIIRENFRTKTFITDKKIKAKPGQFVMIWLPGVAEKPFSVTEEDPLTITVMSVGKFTKAMNTSVSVGDKIWYRGPFGKKSFEEKKGNKILVAGGCGCVPLYFLGKKLKEKEKTKVIIGAKTSSEILFKKRFKSLGLNVIVTTDNGSTGIKGLATDVLEKILSKEKVTCVYACGPELMLEKVVDICRFYRVKCQLSLESIIKCGFGICGSCSRGEKLICQDGPVFSHLPPKNE